MNFSNINFESFTLQISGVFLALAFLFGTLNFYKKIQTKKISVEFFIHHFWKWLIGAFILGRIFALILNFEIFSNYGFWGIITVWEGGFNFWGLVLGFIGILFLDLKQNDKSDQLFKWISIGFPAFLLGFLILDLGNLLTGNIYGMETILPWAIQYESFGVAILNPIHPIAAYFLIFHFWLLHWIKKQDNFIEKKSIVGKKRGWQKLLFISFFLLPFLVFLARFLDHTLNIKHILVRSDEILMFSGIIFYLVLYFFIKKIPNLLETNSFYGGVLSFLMGFFWLTFLRGDEQFLIFQFIPIDQIFAILGSVIIYYYIKKQTKNSNN